MNTSDSDKQNKSSPFSDIQTAAPKDLVSGNRKNNLDKQQQAQHSIEQNRQADRSDKAGD